MIGTDFIEEPNLFHFIICTAFLINSYFFYALSYSDVYFLQSFFLIFSIIYGWIVFEVDVFASWGGCQSNKL